MSEDNSNPSNPSTRSRPRGANRSEILPWSTEFRLRILTGVLSKINFTISEEGWHEIAADIAVRRPGTTWNAVRLEVARMKRVYLKEKNQEGSASGDQTESGNASGGAVESDDAGQMEEASDSSKQAGGQTEVSREEAKEQQ